MVSSSVVAIAIDAGRYHRRGQALLSKQRQCVCAKPIREATREMEVQP